MVGYRVVALAVLALVCVVFPAAVFVVAVAVVAVIAAALFSIPILPFVTNPVLVSYTTLLQHAPDGFFPPLYFFPAAPDINDAIKTC